MYSIAATDVPVGEDRYGAALPAQSVVVAAGLIPDSALVRYAPVTGVKSVTRTVRILQ
jgi:hypothetical protein